MLAGVQRFLAYYGFTLEGVLLGPNLPIRGVVALYRYLSACFKSSCTKGGSHPVDLGLAATMAGKLVASL
jgi:hypothetical protein